MPPAPHSQCRAGRTEQRGRTQDPDFELVAPQYPKGLKLDISLTGITGDVKEIDILNHYIGMRTMSDAASLESAMSLDRKSTRLNSSH